MSTQRHRALCPRLVILLLVACMPAAASDDVGQPAPVLVVRQLDGHDLDLAALRGKVVILNFWATWCPPCRAEMPVLQAFYEKHAAEGVMVIGVSADDPHERKAVTRVMQQFTYPAALLADARSNGFGTPKVLPISYIIGTDGIIRARLLPTRGNLTEQALSAAIATLLPKDSGATAPRE